MGRCRSEGVTISAPISLGGCVSNVWFRFGSLSKWAPHDSVSGERQMHAWPMPERAPGACHINMTISPKLACGPKPTPSFRSTHCTHAPASCSNAPPNGRDRRPSTLDPASQATLGPAVDPASQATVDPRPSTIDRRPRTSASALDRRPPRRSSAAFYMGHPVDY